MPNYMMDGLIESKEKVLSDASCKVVGLDRLLKGQAKRNQVLYSSKLQPYKNLHRNKLFSPKRGPNRVLFPGKNGGITFDQNRFGHIVLKRLLYMDIRQNLCLASQYHFVKCTN